MILVEIIHIHIINTLSGFASFRDLRESYIPPVDGKIRNLSNDLGLGHCRKYIPSYMDIKTQRMTNQNIRPIRYVARAATSRTENSQPELKVLQTRINTDTRVSSAQLRRGASLFAACSNILERENGDTFNFFTNAVGRQWNRIRAALHRTQLCRYANGGE